MSSKVEPSNLLIIISGPSGVGKDAVLARMKEKGYPFYYAITATTRQKRAGEKHGRDYYFFAPDQFQSMIKKGELLEWAEVYGNYYGVPKEEITWALSQGKDAILKVDVQGAATLKKILPQAVFIFLMPPSTAELERRLKGRSSDLEKDLTLRLEKAREEIERLPLFDYAITSYENKLDDIISQIQAIIIAERCRVKPRNDISARIKL
ncbi:MAG: guanylate kinase [Chloroflexota bacterium]|nr:guanylate kinase [Chloroflexota bacterium]